MLANPFVGDWLFFGGFVNYSQLNGRQKLDWGKFSRLGLLVAGILFVLTRFYHQVIF